MRVVLFAVVLVLLGSLACLFMRAAGSPPPDPAAVQSEDAAEAVTDLRAGGPAGTEGLRVSNAAPTREQPVREEIASSPGPGTVPVLVLDGVSGEPVAGAKVWVLPPSPPGLDDPRDAMTRSEEWLDSYPEHRSGADGTVHVNPAEPYALLIAHHGDLVGAGSARPEVPGGEIRLFAPLTVLAIDPAGQPMPELAIGGRFTSPGGSSPFAFGVTGPDGTLVIPHFGWLAQAGTGSEVYGRILDEFVGNTVVPLDPLPAEPVRISMPRTGSFTLRILDRDGSPFDPRHLPHWVYCQAVSEEVADLGQRPMGRGSSTSAMPEIRDDGTVHIPHVGFGKVILLAHAIFDDRSRFPGPTAAEPDVVREFTIAAERPVLVGRLLDDARLPMAGKFALSYRSERWPGGEATFQTDATGAFVLVLSARVAGLEPELEVRGEPGQDPRIEGVASIPLFRPLTGRIDLGEIVLAAAPLIVAGQLVMPEAEPGVPITLEHQTGRTLWQEVRTVTRQDLGEGRFEYRGLPLDGPLRLRLLHGVWLPVDPIEFERGATDLHIELQPAGSMTATFVVESGDNAWRGYEYSLTPLNPKRPESVEALVARRFLNFEGGVGVEFQGLETDTYTLTVRAPGAPDPLVTIAGVAVVAAQAADDPRLKRIDLRGKIREIHITLTGLGDRIGNLLNTGVIVANEGTDWPMLPANEGVTRVSVQRPVDLYVVAPGYRTVHLEGVFDDREVAMQLAPEVTFVLRGLPTELPAGVTRDLGLYPSRFTEATGPGASRLGPRAGILEIDDSGRATIRVPYPHTARLRLMLRGQARLVPVNLGEVDLTEVRDGQEFVLDVDPEKYAAALERIGK